MYQNYIFDLYGTLVDIHTNEKKAYLWKKMSLFFGMKGAAYEPKELRMAYETKIKEQEAALKMECRGSHVPEIDIADVFRQLFEDQAVSVTEEEIADLAKMFRAICDSIFCSSVTGIPLKMPLSPQRTPSAWLSAR